MATYDKLIYDIPPYQEGNEADFEFELDENFPIDQVSDITFQVMSLNNTSLMAIKKTDVNSKLTVTGRVVTIKFLPADTIGKEGKHKYEIDFINPNGNPFATIGGAFTVNAQINTL
jgi:hypothetical protein